MPAITVPSTGYCRPLINKPLPLTRDHNGDPNIKALKRRGFISQGLHYLRRMTYEAESETVGSILAGQFAVLSGLDLQDLLTIRADRDVYYYGCDALLLDHKLVQFLR